MSLDVHLYGERIGTLFPAGDNDYRFAYDPDVVARVGAGTGLLSNSLPARPEPFSAEATRAYVEGLLPEGQRRARMGRELDLNAGDGYLLLVELGRDCPGAVTFIPGGEEAEPRRPEEIAWLDEEELTELVKPPPPAYFSEACPQRMRATLPGVRHKLSLVYDPGGERWGWPEAGVPSTHVVKPETGEYPEYVTNEMFCTAVVREVGVSTVEASIERLGGRRCLVSPRYDRVGEGLDVKRIHAETFVQALGVSPYAKEETDEGEAPGFAEASGLLNAVNRGDDIVNLLTIALCSYMLGNGDVHGRNFVLIDCEKLSLDDEGGKLRIAPLTDITSTVVYDDPINAGMAIAEDYQETAYLLELAEICEECEFDFEILRGVAGLTANRLGKAIETVAARAHKDGWHEPIVDKIVELAAERSFGLGAEVEY
ncbi:MAG: HipA domain-containing protein [Solirubrobacterales bacterium]